MIPKESWLRNCMDTCVFNLFLMTAFVYAHRLAVFLISTHNNYKRWEQKSLFNNIFVNVRLPTWLLHSYLDIYVTGINQLN